MIETPDYNKLIGSEVEVTWSTNDGAPGKWHRRWLVAFLPGSQKPFVAAKDKKIGYSYSGWDLCRPIEED